MDSLSYKNNQMHAQQQLLHNYQPPHRTVQHYNSLPGNYPNRPQPHHQYHRHHHVGRTAFPYTSTDGAVPTAITSTTTNEIISCPMLTNGATATAALSNATAISYSANSISTITGTRPPGDGSTTRFFKSPKKTISKNTSSGKFKLWTKGLGWPTGRRQQRSNSRSSLGGDGKHHLQPKQALDKTNSYLLWIGTPVAAR